MRGVSTPFRIQRYREAIDSKSSDPTGGTAVDCGDGSKDPPATIEQDCSHNYAGLPVRADPLLVAEDRPGAHALVSRLPRPPASLQRQLRPRPVGRRPGRPRRRRPPRDPGAGNALLYDAGRTSSLLPAETRALRAGRGVTIERQFEFAFTADCCLEWHEEGKPGTYVRVGAVTSRAAG